MLRSEGRLRVREQIEETGEKPLAIRANSYAKKFAKKSTKVPSEVPQWFNSLEKSTCDIRQESKRLTQKCLQHPTKEFGLYSAGTKRLLAVKGGGKAMFAF